MNRNRMLLVLVGVVLLGRASGVQAQRTAVAPAPSILFMTVPAPELVSTEPEATNHWETGAVIGGLAGLTYGAIKGSQACDGNPCVGPAVAFGLITGFIGSFAGAMVGTLFPKN